MIGPKTSFLMPTFGRVTRQPELIAEAVWWFTRQTWENKELLILNDAPKQQLVCKAKDVRVINWPVRIPTLGEKMNVLIDLALGEICLPCEDDDISMPARAGQAVEALDGFDYWTPGMWVYHEKGRPLMPDGKGVGHNCSAYRRSKFFYPSITHGHDMVAHDWAMKTLRFNPNKITNPSEITYIYRWGYSQYHLSGHRDMEKAYADYHPGPDGVYEIIPMMRGNYFSYFNEMVDHCPMGNSVHPTG